LMTLAACGPAKQQTAPRNQRNVLTAEEITRVAGTDAFSVVQALRPHWLIRRGPSSINFDETIKVYLDGNLMGGIEQLKQINVHSISEIRHMDGIEATQRYGLDHGQGAILVVTRVQKSY